MEEKSKFLEEIKSALQPIVEKYLNKDSEKALMVLAGDYDIVDDEGSPYIIIGGGISESLEALVVEALGDQDTKRIFDSAIQYKLFTKMMEQGLGKIKSTDVN